MSDLIDRNVLFNEFVRLCGPETGDGWDNFGVKALIERQPAVDAVPVVYSEWSWADGGKCKNCGFHNSNFDYNYCPMCGAKIRR